MSSVGQPFLTISTRQPFLLKNTDLQQQIRFESQTDYILFINETFKRKNVFN